MPSSAVDLNQIQRFLASAQNAEGLKSDLKKALRKISGLLVNLQSAVDEADAMFGDAYVPSQTDRKPRAKRPSEMRKVDPAAPYGRRNDGTPKGKPGVRPKEADAVE
jgi:hypothetical protein